MREEIIIKEIMLCFENQYEDENKNNKMFFERVMKNNKRIITEQDMKDYDNFLESLNSQIKIIRNIQDSENEN